MLKKPVIKIAVTGGLSSGKSTVCNDFKELGAFIVSADTIVHQLLSSKTPLGKEIIALLGPEIVMDGEIDRAQIAKKVFSDETALKKLEQLLHPTVMEKIDTQYQNTVDNGTTPFFVAEVPLLFEAQWERHFDHTIAVVADPSICKARFQGSTGYGEDEYKKRMARQYTMFEKARRADFVVVTNGSRNNVRFQVQQLYKKVLRKKLRRVNLW